MARFTDHESRITSHESPLWVIVPVRGMAEGKSRLSGLLAPRERARLNRRLLEHTLHVVREWRGDLSRCVVVSACRDTLAAAARPGAAALDEGAKARGLNAAAALGREYA